MILDLFSLKWVYPLKILLSRLRVRNGNNSSFSYMQRSMEDSVCNIPVSGESKDTRNWFSSLSSRSSEMSEPSVCHMEVGCVYTLIHPYADSWKDTIPWWSLWYYSRSFDWTILRILASLCAHLHSRWLCTYWTLVFKVPTTFSSITRTNVSSCLPDVVQIRDVSQIYLIKLTNEESKSGSFLYHHKDRNTWGRSHVIHLKFIDTKTIVMEYNDSKGVKEC